MPWTWTPDPNVWFRVVAYGVENRKMHIFRRNLRLFCEGNRLVAIFFFSFSLLSSIHSLGIVFHVTANWDSNSCTCICLCTFECSFLSHWNLYIFTLRCCYLDDLYFWRFFFGIASTLSSSASINRTCAMAIVANAKTAIQHKAHVRRHHHLRYSKIFRRQMLNTWNTQKN